MKRIFFLLLAQCFLFTAAASEGMWIPYLIGQLNHQEMEAMGLELSPEDLYSINESSLKDAIVHFNGGCTASLISQQGLLLTNHHCGYSQIQSHSSLEKNYLRDGFWAENQEDELSNPGMTASIVQYLEDVTNTILTGTEALYGAARDSAIRANIKNLLENWENPRDLVLEVKPFFYGRQYLLIAKEQFRDIRLVGAPPSSIGKFGADTDNWVWPRHTGDFSLFRIYAGADNRPADLNANNRPYQARKHLSINLDGVAPGDFTMVYGFPGSTVQYLPAAEVNNIVSEYNPLRIAIRDEILAILDRKMRRDEATRIRYASKYARISNSWKRWKGEILGVERTQAIERIRNEERALAGQVLARPELAPFANLVAQMVVLYEQRVPHQRRRYAYIEAGYFGQELQRHLLGYGKLLALADQDDEEGLAPEGAAQVRRVRSFYRDFDAELEEEIAQAVMPLYWDLMPAAELPELIAEGKSLSERKREEWLAEMFADNPVLDTARWTDWLANNPAKAAKKLKKSRAYQLARSMYDHFFEVLNPQVGQYDQMIDSLQARYVEALQLAFPKKKYYPDANGTLRIAYGKVQGYEARDAVNYAPRTFLEGVMEKYVPGDYEFDLPEDLIKLYQAKDYGPYALDGKMPVCFVATNHTTGGNSGSPVLNGRGELVGLNFDRAWDGVMSDMFFDPSICRNIMVDMRYVLFIVDKFAGAQRLIKEMDLVRNPAPAAEEVAPATEG